jgi:FAD/FMN-containing dehydrogenase
MPDSAHGWSQHFGEQWPRMQQARRTFDPGGLFGSAYRVFDDPPAR